jgi:hypothetical protein
MLRLFRHIRQRLFLLGPEGSAGHALSGKVSRYLGYAIGEIVLIVVGILIALEANEWKEKGKEREQGRLYIKAIYQDLRANQSRLGV